MKRQSSNPKDIVQINGHYFQKHPDIQFKTKYGYKYNYYKLAARAYEYQKNNQYAEMYALYRKIILDDLWFIIYFILGVPVANHPFIVQGARMVEDGPATNTLDLWARGHFKTTTVSIAETVQTILRDREERGGIFSYSKKAALKIFWPVREVLQNSTFLKCCFPDVLWADPQKEAPKWGDETGIIVRRDGFYREPTLAAYGLIEGMPTGDHLTFKVADDLVTEDIANSPSDTMEKLKVAWEQFLNIKDATKNKVRIVGTIYDYNDLYIYLMGQKDVETSEPIYHVRKRPATVDGSVNGEPVFLTKKDLNKHKLNKKIFAMQYLLDPAPAEYRELDSRMLKRVTRDELPQGLFKFMPIDPAGERKDGREGDAWAIPVIGVEPYRDELGASNIYILDLVCKSMKTEEAFDEVVNIYMRNGLIMQVGVEKVGQTTFEIHIAKALSAKGKLVSVETGTLRTLSPKLRKKQTRINDNLVIPLNNGKVHYLDTIPEEYIGRLFKEMDKFPYWHDDALDAISYVYDMIADYRFGTRPAEVEKDKWDDAFIRDDDYEEHGKNAWMMG